MEDVRKWASNGNGNGDGYGNGNGYGYGNGYDNGDGYGEGYGYGNGNDNGDGYGDGYGDGNGYGIKSINGLPVTIIDGVPNAIKHIHGNIESGFIIRHNTELVPLRR